MERSARILVANRPKLMRDVIVVTLSEQPGIEIVAEVSQLGRGSAMSHAKTHTGRLLLKSAILSIS